MPAPRSFVCCFVALDCSPEDFVWTTHLAKPVCRDDAPSLTDFEFFPNRFNADRDLPRTMDYTDPRKSGDDSGLGHSPFSVKCNPCVPCLAHDARRGPQFNVDGKRVPIATLTESVDPIRDLFHEPFDGRESLESRTPRRIPSALAQRSLLGRSLVAKFL